MVTVSEEASRAVAPETAKMCERYLLARNFVLRMTGFPVELIDSLAAPKLADLTDEALAARQRYVTGSHALLSSPLISRSMRRELKRGLPLDGNTGDMTSGGEALSKEISELNRALACEVELRRRSDELYGEELERVRKLLYQFVMDKPFQEVLLLSSSGLGRFTPKEPHPPAVRNSHVRQREFSWISYLQRLTTKNETISFFGPCTWGEFDTQEPAAVAIKLSEQHVSERAVYVERWVCDLLAELMSADPQVQPLLPLRLADDLAIEGTQGVFLNTGKTVPLSPAEREFLESCANSKRYSLESPLAGNLLEQKVLIRVVQVPVTPLPFQALRREVASWPPHSARARWQENLEEIDKAREAIERASDLESRRLGVNAITGTLTKLGLEGRRDSQALYASRLPINEDCRLGARKLTLGQPVMEQLLNDAVPWYDLWRDVAGLYATRLHDSIRDSWQSLGQKPVPLPLFWPSMLKAWALLPNIEQEIQQAWHHQLGDRSHESLVLLTEEDTGFLRKNFSLRRMKAFDNMAPDLQIVAADAQAVSDGRWSLLIAEIHPDFASWQHCFFIWCPDSDSYAKDYAHQGGQGTAAVIGRYPPYFTSAHTALWIYPYAHQWEFVGVPGPEGTQALRSAETLVVVADDDVLLLHTSGRVLGSLLHTWNTSLNTHRLELKGHADHSPRLQVGRVIVQRETWGLEPDTALRESVKEGGPRGFAALRHFRKQHGLPEQVFVRGYLPERMTLDKDIKPVFMDFRNPLLMEVMSKMILRFPRLSISEMLPRIQDCWLERAGAHYSSEFRTVVMASRDSRLESMPIL